MGVFLGGSCRVTGVDGAADVDMLFRKIDDDSSGTIECDEFITWWEGLNFFNALEYGSRHFDDGNEEFNKACREEAWELIRPTDKPRRSKPPPGTPAVRQRTDKWLQSPLGGSVPLL
ncbi:hypothetical protein T484DRAFT_2281502 [Baffinella frigidus]|nr:hypothetical protein T484DRAFT_2281502 [Cryptophyta sp. CCMP2293]